MVTLLERLQAKRLISAFLLVSGVYFLCSTPAAWAWSITEDLTPQQVKELKRDISAGNAADVYALLKEPIFNGEVTPQFLMGLTHEQANNKKNALDWYRIAAQGKSTHALYRLGLIYEQGYLGQAQNFSTAFQYYEKAAELGYSKAQIKVATTYDKGLLGVTPNKAKAFQWYLAAAENGIPLAQFALGNMYNTGTGTAKQVSRAYHWYEKAAESGLAVAQYKMGQFYRETALNKPGDSDKAFYWFSKAANKGLANAQLELGLMYEEGLTPRKTKPDTNAMELPDRENQPEYEKAAYWYKQAALQGSAEGQMALGTFYMMGWGVDQDFEEAHRWLSKSSAQGNATANTWLKLIQEKMSPEAMAQLKNSSRKISAQ